MAEDVFFCFSLVLFLNNERASFMKLVGGSRFVVGIDKNRVGFTFVNILKLADSLYRSVHCSHLPHRKDVLTILLRYTMFLIYILAI